MQQGPLKPLGQSHMPFPEGMPLLAHPGLQMPISSRLWGQGLPLHMLASNLFLVLAMQLKIRTIWVILEICTIPIQFYPTSKVYDIQLKAMFSWSKHILKGSFLEHLSKTICLNTFQDQIWHQYQMAKSISPPLLAYKATDAFHKPKCAFLVVNKILLSFKMMCVGIIHEKREQAVWSKGLWTVTIYMWFILKIYCLEN